MWRNISLRTRINCLVALVLSFGLAANVGRLVLEAGPRVQAEDQSVIRLTRAVIESIGPGVNDAQDPGHIDRIVADLNRLRHVSIVREARESVVIPKRVGQGPNDARAPPSWFVALIHPERVSVSVPVWVAGKQQALTITSHPDDEIQEIWDGVVTQLTLGLVAALALFVMTSMVVRHALAPLDALSQAMKDIEAGRYLAHVVPSGAPELASLCEQLHHLAVTLDGALEDRRRLAERMVSLQDLERKDIARELHDEFGPYLFAMRAHTGAVMRLADQDPARRDMLSKHGTAILAQIDALQQFNRRLLERLRPVGLADLGLLGAIEALLRLWSDTHPDIAIEHRISPLLVPLGEAADLTAYRVIQEALTNVFRHAQATRVSVTVEPVEKNTREQRYAGVMIRVCDDGRGLDPNGAPGFGLMGMRERVWALGGKLTIVSHANGLAIEAMIPATQHTPSTPTVAGREFVPDLSGS